ncbi:hypothetical protein PENTCL1PPCAC_23228, partial [Pristionchus entomophagus]
MSTKHLKKLMEEKKVEVEEEEQSESEEEVGGPINRFAMLNMGDEEEGKNESEEEEEEVKREQKGDNAAKKKKKNNKKNKKKANQKKKVEEDPFDLEKRDEENFDDEIDSPISLSQLTEACESAENLFKFDSKMIDPMVELRKSIGKAFRMEGRTQEVVRGQARKSRYVVTKHWPLFKKGGLSMEIALKRDAVTYFKFVHGTDYRNIEKLMRMGELTHNPELVNEAFMVNPYHLNSLLIRANTAFMQEDVSVAMEMLCMGIYGTECASHALFNLSSWNHRLDYNQFENRAIFLILHRYIFFLERRRSFNTALNYAKLLFSLDPVKDPVGTMLLMDSLALKARQYEWLNKVYEQGKTWKNLHLLPNWQYSIALAAFHTQDETADEKLLHALTAFPSVFVAIANAIQLNFDPATASRRALTPAYTALEPSGVQLLSSLYARQTELLWKNPAVLAWAEKIVTSIGSDYGSRMIDEEAKEKRLSRFAAIPPQIKRCLFLSDIPLQESTTLTDPFPPKQSKCDYDRELSDTGSTVAQESVLARFLHSLYPSFDESEGIGEGLARAMEGAREWARGALGGGGGGGGGEGAGGDEEVEIEIDEEDEGR